MTGNENTTDTQRSRMKFINFKFSKHRHLQNKAKLDLPTECTRLCMPKYELIFHLSAKLLLPFHLPATRERTENGKNRKIQSATLTSCSFISSSCNANNVHKQEGIKNIHQSEKKVIFDMCYRNKKAPKNCILKP